MSSQKTLLLLAALGAGVLVLLVMLQEVRSGASDLPLADLRWPYIVVSFVCLVGLVIAHAVAWWVLMCRLERRRVSFVATTGMFAITWPGRYLPASLPHYAGRLVAGPAAGMSRSGVAASIAYENLIALAVGSVGTLICLLFVATGRQWRAGWITVPILLAVVALVALHPVTLRLVIQIASSRIRMLATLRSHVLPPLDLAPVVAIHAAAYVLVGVAFYLSLRALGEAPPPLLAIGAYNLAGLVGILAIGVPGGLGVREAVVVALVGSVVGAPAALTAALLTRIISIVADCVPAFGAGVWMTAQRVLRSRAASHGVAAQGGKVV